MIPSSPRRTWIFLLVSSLVFFGPGFLAPAAWDKNVTYLLLSSIYQGTLVVAGFWYGPAICRALVLKEVVAGPLRQAVDSTLAELRKRKGHVNLDDIPVTLAEYSTPFIVTLDFPYFSRHLIMSKQNWSKSNEKCPLYSRIQG